MKSLKQKYFIKATPKEVWAALTDADHITHWGGGRAKMKPEDGFSFELWDGDIYGKNTQVVVNKKLAQDWYAYDWEKPSKVVFTLTGDSDGTNLLLEQTDIPDKEFDEISEGWKEYYCGKIKEYLEQS